MNKHCFRVIFNRARGLLVAVAECVAVRRTTGGAIARGAAVTACVLTVRPLTFGLWLAFGTVMPAIAQTQVVADPNAAGTLRPVIGVAGNGVPVVNIQTPNAAGVSRNAYSQFDVDRQGVVLNNANNPAQTQQAGWIAANPMLAGGTARVILNEVNSANPSLLRGYVEVGGSRAQLVIANPSGIHCDGCGFINANRATLTTGTPVSDGVGNLTGYRVRDGIVAIGAGGMDAGSSDYTAVLARAVQVQGNIKAAALNVVAGANDISADLARIDSIAAPGDDAPVYGIDVAVLGGMYAGKIMLTANELGVGVRNAGTLGATAGDVVVTSNGQLINSRQIQASAGNVTLNAAQGMRNSGTIKASAALNATSVTAVNNLADATLSGQTVSVVADVLDNRGTIAARDGMQLMLASALDNGSGASLSAAGLTIDAANVTNRGDIGATGTLALTATGQLDNQTGGRLAATDTRLTSGSLINRGGIDGGHTRIQTGNFDLLGTGLVLGDQLSIGAGALTIGSENGTAAVAAARQRLDLGVQTLTMSEHALLHSEGDMAIGGQLDSNGQATGKANSLTLSSARIEAMGMLAVDTGALSLKNAHFTSQLQPDPRATRHFIEYQGSGAGTRYTPGTPGVYVYNDESDHLQTPDGSYESWLRYDYTRSVQTEVVTRTDPATISVGRNFILNADTVLNDKSTVTVGGQLAGAIGSLTNTDGLGQQIIHDAGNVTSFWRKHKKGRDSTGSSSSGYHPADQVLSLTLQPAEWLQNTQSTAQYRTSSLVLPTRVDSSLFKQVADPQSHYLVETDPRFTHYKTWLSTDYMLQQLSSPTVMQKRLGDGYYEQRMVREQVAQLTGRRFLQGYGSDEAQFQALMNNGVTASQALKLQPGIALTDAQVAQLTSNIVWLVNQPVTLPDGSVTEALVPKVYARPDSVTVTGTGTLIAASDLKLNVVQRLTNGGTLAGWQSVAADAQNLTLTGGQVYGDQVALAAQNDLNVQGGSIVGHSGVSLQAGHDLTLQSTTASTQSVQGSQTNIANVANVSVDGANAALSLSAGNDLNMRAARIGNSGQGGRTQLVTGRDINLSTVTAASDQTVRWNGDNWRHDAHSQEVGSAIQTNGDITLAAGRDAHLTAASLSSDQGALNIAATHDVNVTAGRTTARVDEAHKHTGKSGFLASNTITTRDTVRQDVAAGSTLSANTLTLDAGRNLTVSGSNAVATQQVSLLAGQDVTINNAVNHIDEVHQKEERTSGLFSGGGLGVTIGVRQRNLDQRGVGDTAAAATVGSTHGNVSINAGQHYQQVGSQVATPSSNVDITAKRVDIIEARNTRRDDTEQRFKQTGISVAITSPILSAIQTAQQMKSAAGQTGDTRMKALAAGTAALSGYGAYDQTAKALADKGVSATQVSGINISINLGTSQSQSHTTQSSDHAASSSVAAGGNIKIAAAGDGANSDLTVRASNVHANGDIALSADHAINLLAAKDSDAQHSNNKNFGASVGVSFGSNGLMFNASVNGGRGRADGTDETWVNSHVAAGNQLTLTSGGDSTLKGAVASGKQVTANVGGNLNIESLQDTSKYDSKQQSYGGSISVGAGVMSGSVSMGNSKVKSDYASVVEQSGIQAGDNGFQVAVQGNTDLKGAVIASTDAAVQGGKNSFATGGALTMSDLYNHADYEGDSFQVGLGGSMKTSAPAPAASNGQATADNGQTAATDSTSWFRGGQPGSPGSSAGFGRDSGSASSTTYSGISGLAGNTAVRTGDPSSGIDKIFDANKVQSEINAQTRITQAFGQQASKLVGDYASGKMKEANNLQAQAIISRRNGHETEASQLDAQAKQILDQWGDTGSYRIALHTAIGGLTGGAAGAAGSLTGTVTASQTASWLESAGITQESAPTLYNSLVGLASTTAGALVGGVTGTGTAFNEVSNNKLLHDDQLSAIKRLAQGDKDKEEKLLAAACSLIKCSAEFISGSKEYAVFSALEKQGAQYTAERNELKNYSYTERQQTASGYPVTGAPVTYNNLFNYSPEDQASDGMTLARSYRIQQWQQLGMSHTVAKVTVDGADFGVLMLGMIGNKNLGKIPLASLSAEERGALQAAEQKVAKGAASNVTLFERQRATYAAQEIRNAQPIGSALKDDSLHRSASFVIDKIPENGRLFSMRGGDNKSYNLTQMKGVVDGKSGIFEWIVNSKGQLTHQRFIPGGKITGTPNQTPSRLPKK